MRVFPPTERPPLNTWVGVGGSPESVVRAARYGFPLMLAIIGGDPRRFAPYVDLYHRALASSASRPLPVGVHSPGHIADTDEQARDELWPALRGACATASAPSAAGRPTSRAEFEREVAEGALYVGSPETVARKIAGPCARSGSPLRPEVQRGHAAPRAAHEHRAVRPRGHPAGAGAPPVASIRHPCFGFLTAEAGGSGGSSFPAVSYVMPTNSPSDRIGAPTDRMLFGLRSR